jgi:hypothetical protein
MGLFDSLLAAAVPPTAAIIPPQQQQLTHIAAAAAAAESDATSTNSSIVIRHSGKAHVRGKIRRIWRPRYLELWGNGLVRYYELPAETSTGGASSELVFRNNNTNNYRNEGRTNAGVSTIFGDGGSIVPKYTLRIYYARMLDVTTFRDMHTGLPNGCYGFLFRGQRLTHLEQTTATTTLNCQPSSPSEQEQRDILCAVSTLEAAQMWCVALQWASSVQDAVPRMPSVWNLSESMIEDEEEMEAIAAAAKQKKAVVRGKVVVSQVVQFRIVRLSGITFEIAYEIHGMLLLASQQKAEQWSILRTADDFENLIGNMCQELGPSLLDRAQLGPIRRLPRLRDRPRQTDLLSSLNIVNSVLRSLVMDASMVNASSMKTFLGLSAPVVAPQRWRAHDAHAVLERSTVALPDNLSVDQYVKKWLAARPVRQSALDAYAADLFQRPLLAIGGLIAGTAAIGSLATVWHHWVPRLQMRLDYLVISHFVAAYIGRDYLPSSLRLERIKLRKHVLSKHNPDAIMRPKATENKDDKIVTSTIEKTESTDDSVVMVDDEFADFVSAEAALAGEESEDDYTDEGELNESMNEHRLSSPLPKYPANDGISCWSQTDDSLFYVRGHNYFSDRVKVSSGKAPLTCRGVDVWLTDNPQRHIASNPAVLGGKLDQENTFLVNFLLPFGNFVAYFSIPPLDVFPARVRDVWTNFLRGDQEYRDKRLKLLPVVLDGPWIVKTAVGPGKSPALLGKVIPLQYYFRDPDENRKGVYEVDVIITASTIAKGILSVVKGHTKSISIGFAFIIEAAEQQELPETVLCSFEVRNLCLEDCPILPEMETDSQNEDDEM